MNIKDEYGQFQFSEPEKRKHGLDRNCKIIPKQQKKSDGGGSVAGPQLWFIWPLGGGQGDQPTF